MHAWQENFLVGTQVLHVWELDLVRANSACLDAAASGDSVS